MHEDILGAFKGILHICVLWSFHALWGMLYCQSSILSVDPVQADEVTNWNEQKLVTYSVYSPAI